MALAVVKKLSQSKITKFKNAILGRDFELSVAYVTRVTMRTLNREQRKIDKPTDILSFSYSKKSGEIVLCLPEVATHAKEWGVKTDAYLPYLFIHGLIHIKGHDHGAIMDREEKKYCRALGVTLPQSSTEHGTTNRSGHRRGDLSGSRRRVSIRR